MVLLFVAAGCARAAPSPLVSTPPAAGSTKTGLFNWEDAKLYGPQNMSVSGVDIEQASPKPAWMGFHTFRVEPSVIITAPYHYLNRSDHAIEYRVFVLLDEKQLRGGIGDDPNALYSDATLEAGAEITLTVTLPPLTPGVHDCILIGILNPADPTGLNASRVALLAGDTRDPMPRNYETLANSYIPLGSVVLFITDHLDESSEVLKKWDSAQAAPGQAFKYAIYAGYQAVPGVDTRQVKGVDLHQVAILAFMDHKQVPVQAGGEMVFYGQMSKGVIGRQLGSVQVPLEPGPHNLLVLLIENPGVILSDIVRGPDVPGPASLLLWDVIPQDVAIQVREH
jgi:hypothetical protein